MFKLKSFFSKKNRANWLLFAILAFSIFIKCCMGHFFMYHSILISSLWKMPLFFWSFYLPKVSISILLASFVFLFQKKWWIIILSVLIDIWMLANVIYFRVYEGVIDGYVLMMTSNLKGFTSSIFSIIEWKDLLFFLISGILALLVYLLKEIERRSYVRFISILLFSCILWAGSTNLIFYKNEIFSKKEKPQLLAPLYVFTHPLNSKTRRATGGVLPAIDFSILHMFFFAIDDIYETTIGAEAIPIITEEEERLLQSLKGTQYYVRNNQKLILILFESLENWVVQPEFMPNTYRLINTEHSFFAHKLRKQTYSGGSADGQMIVNTGVLPINKGAACFSYPFNSYPSLPKEHAVTLLPHSIDVWNQKCMSPAYGYDTTIVTTEENAFLQTASFIKQGYDMVQIVTIISHEPFGGGASSTLALPESMPNLMSDYIQSVNVTDRYIGYMIDSLALYQLLDSTTIFITGDHTIFYKEMRDKFLGYCKTENLNYGIDGVYCPLIIFSPYIKQSSQCYEEAYQMDVFPTVVELLGYKDYYWKGFGVNLMDTIAIRERQINEHDASVLSDKLIRNNYFAKIKQ